MNYAKERSHIIQFLFTDKASAPLWLIIRVYLGYEWLMAGIEKMGNPIWFGSGAGKAIEGFAQGALTKTGGVHPDVSMWYASFLQNVVLPHSTTWSNAIALGEVLVGLGLIVGLCTATAAFFGFFMNLNYLLSGTVSVNPQMLILALLLMLASRVAGYWGLDRVARPYLHKRFPRLL